MCEYVYTFVCVCVRFEFVRVCSVRLYPCLFVCAFACMCVHVNVCVFRFYFCVWILCWRGCYLLVREYTCESLFCVCSIIAVRVVCILVRGRGVYSYVCVLYLLR